MPYQVTVWKQSAIICLQRLALFAYTANVEVGMPVEQLYCLHNGIQERHVRWAVLQAV